MMAILIFLTATAFVVIGYMAGAVRNTRRPIANHQKMARLIQRLIDQDKVFPTMPTADREEADDLIDDFYNLPTPKEIN
jgi:hypothetical protein